MSLSPLFDLSIYSLYLFIYPSYLLTYFLLFYLISFFLSHVLCSSDIVLHSLATDVFPADHDLSFGSCSLAFWTDDSYVFFQISQD